jgi:hypothetical protein
MWSREIMIDFREIKQNSRDIMFHFREIITHFREINEFGQRNTALLLARAVFICYISMHFQWHARC